MDKIAVLIPCLNEELTIAKVITDFRSALPEARIYVYDNNSTDHTAEIAKKFGAIVKKEPRQGKGNVIRRMFHDIDAQCYILVDGDDTYPAEMSQKLANEILCNGFDMAIGDRISLLSYSKQNTRRFHNFGNMLVRKIINFVFKSDIRDVMTGYRALSYCFVKSLPILSKGFEIETEMTIHCLDRNLLYINVPIQYRNRPEGSISKLKTYDNGLQVLYTIFTLYRNCKPFRFFSLVSTISLIISMLFLLPVIQEFIKTRTVQSLPSFIACVFFGIAALLSFFQGLSLDNNNYHERCYFELEYRRCKEHLRNVLTRDDVS